jgi:hypothetical protein
MVTDASNRTTKRTKKVHGVIEHIEKQFQKYFVPGKNVAIDESTVGFKGKIKKNPTKWGLRLFILADSDIGYVHSIIPYYEKITGEVCNLPYPNKPFTTRTMLSLMDHLGLSVSGIRGYHLFTDRYYSSVDLAKELDKRECYTTGTIVAGRVRDLKTVRQGLEEDEVW